MSIDEVKKKITDSASEKARKIRSEADVLAREIVRENDANITNLLDSGRSRYKENAHLQKNRRLGVARVEVRNRRLDVKQEAIENVIDETLDRLLALPDDRYLELMRKLFLKADIPECDCQVQISTADKARITPEFLRSVEGMLSADGRKTRLTLSDIPRDDIRGGFIARAGLVEIDCSLGAVLKIRRGEMEQEAARLLFGGSDV